MTSRVRTTELMLRVSYKSSAGLGVCKLLLDFFQDFLAPRMARVAVDGSLSLEFVLQNMRFQGTALGPNLWNVYFADVHGSVERNGARDRRFADDLSVSKEYARQISNEDVVGDLRASQRDIHAWGGRNRVTFDPLKEEFAILATQGGNAQPFRLLGQLSMRNF